MPRNYWECHWCPCTICGFALNMHGSVLGHDFSPYTIIWTYKDDGKKEQDIGLTAIKPHIERKHPEVFYADGVPPDVVRKLLGIK